jgi:peptide methionine sulfoxide reductase msrA/msrB
MKKLIIISAVLAFLTAGIYQLTLIVGAQNAPEKTANQNEMFEPEIIPAVEEIKNIPKDAETLTLAGGCFWCIETAFDNQEGVYAAISGYSGGSEDTADYYAVAGGQTEHREAVKVYFDKEKVNAEELLRIFWQQIDPTDAGGQFADRGYQYTTAVYYENDEQKAAAEKTRQELIESGKFEDPIVTEIIPYENFFLAEEAHQNYAQKRSAHYQMYKKGSGRAGYIEEKWGEE